MSSSLLGLMLSAVLANSSAALPAWNLNYDQAQKLSAREHKPLAVVLGNGSASWDRVVAGPISDETAAALRNNYICVYIDTQSPEGQKLAKAFEMTSGLVISDRTGELQAFRRQGNLTDGDLQRTAVHYADAGRVVRTTDTVVPNAGVITTSNYQPVHVESNYQAAPPVQHYQPAPVNYFQPSYPSGSCPNCRPSYR